MRGVSPARLIVSEPHLSTHRHPLAIDSDKGLVANYELMACRSRIEGMCATFGTRIDTRASDFARRSSRDLHAWYTKWDAILGGPGSLSPEEREADSLAAAKTFSPESYERRRLIFSLNMTHIFLYTSVLKNQCLTDTEHLPVVSRDYIDQLVSLLTNHSTQDARELAMAARQSANSVLELCDEPAFRSAVRYATHEVFVDLSCKLSCLVPTCILQLTLTLISDAALLVLKLSKLFPENVDMELLVQRASQLQLALFEFPGAQRFSMTIK